MTTNETLLQDLLQYASRCALSKNVKKCEVAILLRRAFDEITRLNNRKKECEETIYELLDCE